MPLSAIINLVAVGLLTCVQASMFSNNALLGIIGIPILVLWGLLSKGITANEPDQMSFCNWVAFGIAAVFSYLPMLATALNFRITG
jgi:predicted membrane channel-forming protein YqfA (hemolysin III family)